MIIDVHEYDKWQKIYLNNGVTPQPQFTNMDYFNINQHE